MFSKVLVANRGEIAVRVLRACHELGIRTVVAHSEADRDSLAVRQADESVCIGPAASDRSYLNIPNIVSAALVTDCDAVHPGYGFLSENAYLAEVVEQVGLTFVGPPAGVIEMMGDKLAARAVMDRAGVPIVPGSVEPLHRVEDALELAHQIGYPVMLKAVAGGGGRGIRPALDERELARQFPIAQREAQSFFGNGALYLERRVEGARHVEVQLLADNHGSTLSLGERDCTLQRRRQKILEEAPSPGLSPEQRRQLGEFAVRGAREANYRNAGTMEFLLGQDGSLYFMEVNCRIQVEHGVTEMVTGVDLVKEQLRIAAGEPMSIRREDVQVRGHAVECRITSEDPRRDFAPESGPIETFLPPGGPGVRVDTHCYSGYFTPPYYDSLLAKIVTWGRDRTEALDRMARALRETRIEGVKTTIPYHLALLDDPDVRAGDVTIDFVNRHLTDWAASQAAVESAEESARESTRALAETFTGQGRDR
ncbi:MAG: acetyl-CoA carboxylase biotin carboxylase subunit [Chloroflexi bacterium]|nr:acetyl-CoA carboxylase biotin carboxylase subunit [Chloroflexota bacterium]